LLHAAIFWAPKGIDPILKVKYLMEHETVGPILHAKVDESCRGKPLSGKTALFLATNDKYWATFAYLLTNCNANPNVLTQREHIGPLHVALVREKYLAVQQLMEAGADPALIFNGHSEMTRLFDANAHLCEFFQTCVKQYENVQKRPKVEFD
jgi:hypothetical protein